METRVRRKGGVQRDGKNRSREKLDRMKMQQVGCDRMRVGHKEYKSKNNSARVRNKSGRDLGLEKEVRDTTGCKKRTLQGC